MESKNYMEEDVVIHGKYELKGTLTIPEGVGGKYPAVILIVGSGTVDRNGCAAKAKLVLNSYTQLLDMITGLGFVTLRFDKRGVGESGGDYYETGMWDMVDDVVSIMEYLGKHPSVDPEKIILMGHSEGSMLATIANTRKPAGGMILMSGAAETLLEATTRQREFAIAELLNSKGIKGALYRLIKVDKIAAKQNEKLMKRVMGSKESVIKINLVKLNAKWLREHYSYNVVDDLKKAECPVLAITGSKDSQVNPEKIKDIPVLTKGKGEYCIIENMDHSLKEYSGPMTVINAVKQYRESQKEPVHPELKKVLAEWLLKHYKNL